MPLIVVDDIQDPRLAPYRDLPQQNLTRHSGLFIAEGEKVVERLIASNFQVVSILAEKSFANKYDPLVSRETPIYVASRDSLVATIGFHFHRGIVACGRRKPTIAMGGLLAGLPAQATLVVCPDVQDPTNLGSIIRSTAAFGCAGVVLGGKCADPFSRRVLRVSMGAALHLPIVESTNLAAALTQLAEADFERMAAVLDPAAEPLATTRRKERLALLLGSEGHGLEAQWLALSDRQVTIPMQSGFDSLNVAVAAAVFLYHFCRAES